MESLRDTVLTAACVLTLVSGCSYYDSSLVGAPVAPPPDAGADSAEDSGVCSSARPPPPPEIKDAGGDIEIVLALRTVDYHEATDAKSVGFDLDRTCTCLGEQGSCVSKSTVPALQCDGPGGRDNNAAGLIKASAMLGLTSESFNEGLTEGDWSLLVRIRDYNGLPDDDQVSVAWLVATNLMKPPAWDGTDTWGIKGSCLNHKDGQPDLEDPIVIDKLAYVTGGRVVASLKGGAPLDLIAEFSVIIQDAFLVGDLVKKGDYWFTDHGTLAGIWRTQDMLANLRGVDLGGKALCTDHPLYETIKRQICDAQDISVTSAAPTTGCDGISLAFTFTSGPARLGLAFDVDPAENPCTPGSDPAYDPCY